MQPTDDSALLRQYADNNSDEAFAALVTRHINLVYSVALRQVGNPHAAEEITQAVFIILAKKAVTLRHDKALSSWLFQATRLTANNLIRSESRRHRREEEAYMQSVLDESAAQVWPRIAPLLDDAVAGLCEKDRQAIVLRFYEGRNLHEVGLALGASEDAAEKRVSRALDKLRRFFMKRGVSSTTAIIAGTISAHSVQAAPVALAKSVAAVAIAKGAAASGSTLTLINGALKVMAWTKVKTAVVVGVGVLLAAGTLIVVTDKEPGYEYRGTLKLVFPMAPTGPQTNMYAVTFLSKPPCWELSLTTSNENHKVLSSPKQTYEINLYDNPPDGPVNTCEITIMPGARPLWNRRAEHVWLALLSGKTYINQKLPLADPGLGMVEPSMVCEIKGMVNDASPQQMNWTNQFVSGREIRIEGQFKWLASTNTPVGLTIPTVSQMEMSTVDSDGTRKVASYSELVIDSVTPLSRKPETIPKIPGRNVVYDYRLCDFSKSGARAAMKQYDVRDSKGLDKLP